MFLRITNYFRWVFKLYPWELIESKIIRNSHGNFLEETYVNHETGGFRTETIKKKY